MPSLKLFVDDIRQPWPGWERARTVSEAIRILDLYSVEEVSLDHDIACYCRCGREHSSEETFEPVARYLRASRNVVPAIIRFHTGNPVGGKKMADILGLQYEKHRVDYATFGKEIL